jgi:hypothetical protein
MLSLSEFARLVSERHYHFLSQSLDDLERQVERHRNEQRFMGLHIMNLQRQRTRRHYHPYTRPTSTSSSGLTSSAPSNIEAQHRRRSLNTLPPSPSQRTTSMGSREDPIYVVDDEEIHCEGCQEEGHFIGNCNKEYRFDGRRYVPIPEGENCMEPTYVVDRDYYQQDGQAESGKSTTLMGH